LYPGVGTVKLNPCAATGVAATTIAAIGTRILIIIYSFSVSKIHRYGPDKTRGKVLIDVAARRLS
jgi:hypothetical protein